MFSTLIPRQNASPNPWHALWAMMVGFFMILVDATIVAVANPSIMARFDASYDAVLWVTSAYLLAYAVPLLVAGRLGDRFGPKNLYLLGLTVFTVASLWCGLSDTIGMLIAARVVQGVGAALLTPQTLSTVTRIFPAGRRGVAMSVWGATAGVATLVGPLAGGILVDALGWQWIFFVNVPIGVLGVALALRLVPELPRQRQRLDALGVVLSAVAMFLIVFALQEGEAHEWTHWVWGLMALGIGVMAAFLFWQSINPNDPLLPLNIFRDRNFSLSTFGVATIGFVATGMMVPVMFYAQAVCGLSPTRSALLTAPMAIATGVLAPFVGWIVDRWHPRPVVGFGFSLLAIAMTWLSIEMTPTTPIWRLVLPLTATGVGMAFIWSPLAATATRDLPPRLAGAGSGVYNTTRQVGAVLGSASMAAFMTWQVDSEMPPWATASAQGDAGAQLPSVLHEPFAAAMSQASLLPAFVALFGVVAALFLLGYARRPLDDDPPPTVERGDDGAAFDDDGDEYLEYTVSWDDPEHPEAGPTMLAEREPTTQPLAPRDELEPGQGGDSWRAILDQLLADTPPLAPGGPTVEPNGLAHNGLHLEEWRHDRREQPRTGAEPRDREEPGRHPGADERRAPRQFWFEADGGHSLRDEPGDAPRGGQHSSRWRD